MYEIFKVMLEAAEQIGEIMGAEVSTDSAYFGNRVKISGTTADGSEFELELTVKAKETDHE